MRIARTVLGPIAAFAIVAGATACSSSSDGGTDAAPPSIGPVQQLTDMSHQALPLEAYMLQPGQFATIMSARRQLVTQCMQRFGFDYRPATADGGTDPTAGKTQSQMRYVDSSAHVSAYGYHQEPGVGTPAVEPQRSPTELAVLTGSSDGGDAPGQATGRDIPEGGCFGEVDRTLAQRGVIIQDDELVSTINIEGMSRSTQDPRLKQAFAAWSACMKGKGYTYATPKEANQDPRWSTPTASAEEIGTAVADLACMTENNVVGTWFAVESAYQKQQIEANFEKLEQVRRSIDTSIRVANGIVTAG